MDELDHPPQAKLDEPIVPGAAAAGVDQNLNRDPALSENFAEVWSQPLLGSGGLEPALAGGFTVRERLGCIGDHLDECQDRSPLGESLHRELINHVGASDADVSGTATVLLGRLARGRPDLVDGPNGIAETLAGSLESLRRVAAPLASRRLGVTTQALQRCGAAGLAVVRRMAGDPLSAWRTVAVTTLAHWRPSTPETLALVKTALSDSDPAVRLAAVEGMARFPLPGNLRPLALAVADRSDEVAARAAMLLGQLGKPAHTPLVVGELVSAATWRTRTARLAAIEALGCIMAGIATNATPSQFAPGGENSPQAEALRVLRRVVTEGEFTLAEAARVALARMTGSR